MAGWNYRVLSRTHPNGEISFGIYEVYYNQDGTPGSCTATPVEPSGETLKELKADMIRMLHAFKKPVLKYEDF
jgi:hypothetical protein